MQDFQDDIKTRITFHELDNDGTQIECNVHSKKSQLFYNTNGELFENEILPAIYLVDNRTNCHDLVADGGNITVKYIGAIRGPGVVLADMSEVVKYSQLQGRQVLAGQLPMAWVRMTTALSMIMMLTKTMR